MKVLTAAQMREVDRRTSELGIPGLILMENAAQRVVELLAHAFNPLAQHHVLILCGKGNNGGDGLAVGRQLFNRRLAASLHVVLCAGAAELRGDALENYRMAQACGCPVESELHPAMRNATIVVDALLGTGIKGAAAGRMLELIRKINTAFPVAKVVAVDIPSGMASDSGASEGETVRADYTVTFTAPKVGVVLPPNCDRVGQLRVGPIGSPPSLYEDVSLSLVEPADFADLFRPRSPGAHKGDFGHVLVIAGSRGKTGAAAMAGMAALRSGAGLVTVASAQSAIATIASHAPELMTEPLGETQAGAIDAFDLALAAKKDVVAIGPGLGTAPATVEIVARLFAELDQPMVVDADGLNALSLAEWKNPGRLRVLTPHPGEMARLTGKPVADRVSTARDFAMARHVILVLKGQRSVIAFPDGRVWINPTGSPAMATGGTGDILTGTIAAFLAQFPSEADRAVAAAVYIHGRAAELGAADLGEKSLTATDLLRYYPAAMRVK